jgi:acetyl-CoA carboxylase carboxyl transferase subunit alpha
MEKLEYKEQAAEALKLTSADMKKKKLVDIIPEPLGGAHYDRATTFKTVEQYIMKGFNELKDLSTAELIAQRMEKYSKMGEYKSYKIIFNPSLAVSDFFWL